MVYHHGDMLCMPFLIINMGGEMLYVLEQRLNSQNIHVSKHRKVLDDLISTLFSPKFIDELFRPQKLYSNSATRQVFNRISHSSIMRLNTNSMDKLYDLMAMGFKHQLMLLLHPIDIVQVTMNHFDNIVRMLVDPVTIQLVVNCRERTLKQYGGMGWSQAQLMRATLCHFMQNRRVKICLFLEQKRQKDDGGIIVPATGPLPAGVQVPGKVRYFENGVESLSVQNEQNNGRGVQETAPCKDYLDVSQRTTTLGNNLYGHNSAGPRTGKPVAIASANMADEERSAATKGEMNTLASLIGVGNAGKAPPADIFKIVDLFPDVALNPDGSAANVIVLNKKNWDSELQRRVGDFASPTAKQGDDDDLLSLMDEAGI